MPSPMGLAGVRADLDRLRARLDTMVETAGGTPLVIPAPRPAAATGGRDQQELPGQGVSGSRQGSAPGTADAIAVGLELPALARRRFRAASGCVLSDAGRRRPAGDGPAARHPAAKALALWRADAADDLAWRYDYESRAWGYAALRWLLVDPGDAAGAAGPRTAGVVNVRMRDVARLRAVTGDAAEAARHGGAEEVRRALVGRLSADAGRLLRGRCGVRVNRELLAATAEATLLAGCLTYGCWPRAALAQAYFVQALGLAQACGDRQLGAAILCAMSQQAVFNGHPGEAGKLVSTAVSGSRGVTTPELAVHLRLLTARDHVYRNELAACVRALKDAVTAFDRAGPDRGAGWTRWFTEANPLLFALVLAAAYLAAGLPGQARDTRRVARHLAESARPPG